VALALAQIGEFSFVLAVLATELGLLPDGATAAIVAASIASITINPLLYRAIPSIEKRLLRGPLARALQPRIGRGAAETGKLPASDKHGAIVVGYGPVGEGVCRLLLERQIVPTVVELNIDTVRRLNRSGLTAVYGDASQPEVLEEAGIRSATALIISAPGSPEFAEVIRAARAINPDIQILARSAFLSQTDVLRGAGAQEVFSGEAEVATAMIEAILLRLGATPEQTAAERERARAHLYTSAGRSTHA
jgi:monovalent cation:H+ antiporter-2, CPA2 family